MVLELQTGDFAATVAPAIGGSLRSFTWRGEPVLRTAAGPTILDAACFVMVPYSNRIANGRFGWDGRHLQLPPNKPDVSIEHPLHGLGWISTWQVTAQGGGWCELEHTYPGGDHWPWSYRAWQPIAVTETGLKLSLSVENRDCTDMPAGLGFHPYFPRARDTRLHVLHDGEWQNDCSGIPQRLAVADAPCDWHRGLPVGERSVDTVYTNREGDITIRWPDRRIVAEISCDEMLRHTAIFVPREEDWFCVEPVTHATDALNRPASDSEMTRLEPGGKIAAEMTIQVTRHNENFAATDFQRSSLK